MPDAIAELNRRFGVPERLQFAAGPGGQTVARIANAHAEATVFAQGAQVATFRPHGAEPVLFVSRRARYQPGQAIRGGIPICWPWFGPHPSEANQPDHGLVRGVAWQVAGTAALPGGETELRLALTESDATLARWPHRFRLELAVRVGADLHVALTTHNTDAVPFTWTGALHTYLQVGDVGRLAIHDLDGRGYVDKVDGMRLKRQIGDIAINSETDRVYLDTEAAVRVDDPLLNRRLTVGKSGSRSTVIWNPWAEQAARIDDFAADEYRQLLCVETANALSDAVTLGPGEVHTLAVALSLSRSA